MRKIFVDTNFSPMIMLFMIMLLFTSCGTGQTPLPHPEQKQRKLNIPTLAAEIESPETEPREGRFKMNIRFDRAQYSQSTPLAHQYEWNYFQEADVLVNFSKTHEGYFSASSAEQRKKKAIELVQASIREQNAVIVNEKNISVGSELGKEYELLINGKTTFVRTFADKDIWYLLMVQPKIENVETLIQQLFDSFEFLEKQGESTK